MADLVVIAGKKEELVEAGSFDLNQYRQSGGRKLSFREWVDHSNPANVGFFMSADGLHAYELSRFGSAPAEVHEYELTVAYRLSSARTKFILEGVGTIVGIAFNPAGTVMTLSTNTIVKVWTLSTPWSLATATDTGNTAGLYGALGEAIQFINAGNKLLQSHKLVIDTSNIGTPYDALDMTNVNFIDGPNTEITGNMNEMAFNSDGTKMYIPHDDGTRTVFQYSLSIAYDPSTATYDNKSKDVSAQFVSDLWGMFWKPDGSKFYLFGGASFDTIYQYDLTTNYDVDTATFATSKDLGASLPDSYQFFIGGATPGTRLFTINDFGGASDTGVFAWTLSTAWDISTATQDAGSFDTRNKPGTNLGFSPNSIYFNSAGTVCIIKDFDGSFSKYTLTAWTVSTMVFSQGMSNLFDSAGRGLAVTGDEKKFFFANVEGKNGEGFSFEEVTVALDFSTNVVHLDRFIVNGTDPIVGFTMSLDGTKLHVLSHNTTTDVGLIKQYTLPTPFDINTASYDSISFQVQDIKGTVRPEAIFWGEDGHLLYYMEAEEHQIIEFHATNKPYDITKLDSPILYPEPDGITNPEGISWSKDGTRCYVFDITDDDVYQYDCPVKFSFVGAKLDLAFNLSGQSSNMNNIFFKEDGTKMYVISDADNQIYQYTMTTAFDLGTGSFELSEDTSADSVSPVALYIRADGRKLYLLDATEDLEKIVEYDLSTAYLLSSKTFVQSKEITTLIGIVITSGLYFSPNGLNVFLAGQHVASAKLTTAWDIGTLVLNSFKTRLQNILFQGFAFSDDGTKVYGLGISGNDTIYQYSLSTPFDLNTMSYDSVSEDINAIDSAFTDIAINEDGDRLYCLSRTTTDQIRQFDMSTPLDLTTFSDPSEVLVTNAEENVTRTFFIKPDGLRVYALGNGSTVYQYNLTIAWDLASGSYSGISKAIGQFLYSTNIEQMKFSADGTKLFVHVSGSVSAMSMSIPWDISTLDIIEGILYSDNIGGQMEGMGFSKDGLKYYMWGPYINGIRQHNLKEAFNIFKGDDHGIITEPVVIAHGLTFSPNGKYMYVTGETGTGDSIQVVRYEVVHQTKDWGM